MNRKMGMVSQGKGKKCPFKSAGVLDVDYKDIETLKAFTTERGKILPRRITGVSALFQRKLTKAMEKEKGAKTASALLESSRFTATDLYSTYSSNSAPQPKQTAPSKKESKPLTTSPFGEW